MHSLSQESDDVHWVVCLPRPAELGLDVVVACKFGSARIGTGDERHGSMGARQTACHSPRTRISIGRCLRCARSSLRYRTSGGRSDLFTARALMGLVLTDEARRASEARIMLVRVLRMCDASSLPENWVKGLQ